MSSLALRSNGNYIAGPKEEKIWTTLGYIVVNARKMPWCLLTCMSEEEAP